MILTINIINGIIILTLIRFNHKMTEFSSTLVLNSKMNLQLPLYLTHVNTQKSLQMMMLLDPCSLTLTAYIIPFISLYTLFNRF